jgi:hypothetical protein
MATRVTPSRTLHEFAAVAFDLQHLAIGCALCESGDAARSGLSSRAGLRYREYRARITVLWQECCNCVAIGGRVSVHGVALLTRPTRVSKRFLITWGY